ncbi:hypothetical protein BsWGS_01529 [Bradybaena similaris]
MESEVNKKSLDSCSVKSDYYFIPFTEESYIRLLEREQHLKEVDLKREKHAQDAHLVDGELIFGVPDDEDRLPPENPELKDGSLFTKVYGSFPNHLLGTPIEELDPGIRDKTFVIISSRFRKKYISRFTATRSLFIFPPWNSVRKAALYVTTHQVFDLFIFVTIIFNCVYLASPTLPAAEKLEYIFLAIYTAECCIKIVGRGLILNNNTYLREPWNCLDFFVVVTALVTMLLQFAFPHMMIQDIKGLRTFRVLRALKTISIVPGLKTIVSALLRAFKMMFDVLLLTIFCLMVFAMFGLQLYMGSLRHKCVLQVTGYSDYESLLTYDEYYAAWVRNPENWYYNRYHEAIVCGNSTGAGLCPHGYTCLPHVGDNPRNGFLNFDHFGWALLSCFQLITLDFWEDIYNKILRANRPWDILYFIITIFFGAFYLINLILAVVSTSYEEEAVSAVKEREREKKESARKKHNAMYDVSYLQMKAKLQAAAAAVVKPDPCGDEAITDMNVSAVDAVKIVLPGEEMSETFMPTKFKRVSPEEGSRNEKSTTVTQPSRVTIIKADNLLDPEVGFLKDKVIDRNCDWCEHWMCRYRTLLKAQNYFYVFVSDSLFDLFITFCIILNTTFMSLEHHNQPEILTGILSVENYVFTAIFVMEAGSKIFGLGKYYFLSGWNMFDLFTVVASILDLALENAKGLNVLRAFRLLRVFKLAQSWPTMRLLLTIILSTLGALGNLCLILGIVIYIFAIIGMQLFQDDYVIEKFSHGIPRWNFKDFYHSMLMIFRVLCGEWIEPLYDCMQVSDEVCMAVFLPALVFGNFIVLNLFLALLLNAFASDSIDKHRETSAEKSKLMDVEEASERMRFSNDSVSKNETENACNNSGDHTLRAAAGNCNNNQPKEKSEGLQVMMEYFEDTDVESSRSTLSVPLGPPADCLPVWMSERITCFNVYDDTWYGRQWISLRTKAHIIVNHKIFEIFVTVIIIASSIELAFEDLYASETPKTDTVLRVSNIVFTALFVFEMLLQWLGVGFTAYFTNLWTILDFWIVLVTLITVIGDYLSMNQVTAFKSLRSLRSLRPLRAISRWQGMKIVVNALMNAIPAIGNVFLVCMVFWLIFSIMGVQFFKGKFYRCVNATTLEAFDASYILNKSTCLYLNQSWLNPNVNFDNAAIGFLALFQVATFEGWMEVIDSAVDSTEVDMQPESEASPYSYLYFVIFIIFGSFFSMNLFIGVIIDNFNVLKKKYEGSYLDAFLTHSQRSYYNTLKKIGKKKPQKSIKRPKNKFLLFFYNLSMSSRFEMGIMVFIFLNMVALAVHHYKEPQSVHDVLFIMDVLFTFIFGLEALVKLIGLQLHYFRVAWNIFDLSIVVLSTLGIIAEFVPNPRAGIILNDISNFLSVEPTLLRILHIFRMVSVLRLIKGAKGIRKLLFALIISLPAIFNIGALLFLVMFMYSILGMSSFSTVKLNGALNEIVNFQSFGNSFTLMLRLATSAGWNDVLESLLIKSPYCNHNYYTLHDGISKRSSNGDCGNPYLAIPFMVSYIIIVWLIVINMYIAVILENFNQAHEQEEVGITEDDFDMFYNVWEKYDPLATQFIKYDSLADFVGDLEPPLQIPKPNEIALVTFNIPIMEGDKIHCLDILVALVRNVLSEVQESDELTTLKSQMEQKLVHLFPKRANITVRSSSMQRKKEDVAARTLQRSWRSFKAQRAMRNITALAVQQRIRRMSNICLRSRTVVMDNLSNRIHAALDLYFKKESQSIKSVRVDRWVSEVVQRDSSNTFNSSKKASEDSLLNTDSIAVLDT